MQAVRRIPWRGDVGPVAGDLEAALRQEGLEPRWWSNAPGDVYAPHQHAYHKVLYCAEGSITFVVEPSGQRIVLGPGDRLELPAGTRHAAVVGPRGVRCVEGWRYPSEG